MNENKSNQIMGTITKFLTVIIFIVLAVFLFSVAPYFKPTETFKKGVTHLVVDDKDVTNSLPDPVYIEDDIVMMSDKTIMKFFKDAFVYYDEKYDTAIITSDKMVGKMKIGESSITLNGVEKDIKGTAKMSGDKLFLPVTSIQDATSVDVYYNEKVVATTLKGKSRMKVAEALGNHKLKAYKKELALVTGEVKTGENLYIFDTEGKEVEDYLVIRDERGNIGYYKYGKINAAQPTVWNQGTDYIKYHVDNGNIKYTLVWDYIQSDSFNRNNEKKIESINIISPTWIEVKNADGDLTNIINRDYINWAKDKNYKLWPSVKNDYISMDTLSTIMNDMKLREKLINNIVGLAVAYNLDGINLDFENMYKDDKKVFSEFVRELSSTLRANNVVSSVDVTIAGGSDNYSLCYDRTAIAKAADYILLMAYDQYGSLSKTAGPVASISWVKSNIEEMLGYENVNKNKLILCVPFYSRYWVVDTSTDRVIRSSAIQMSQANSYLSKNKDIAKWDEDAGQYYIEINTGIETIKLWVENEDALKKKIELVNEYGLAGIAAWKMGYEDGDNTWKAIKDTLNVI